MHGALQPPESEKCLGAVKKKRAQSMDFYFFRTQSDASDDGHSRLDSF